MLSQQDWCIRSVVPVLSAALSSILTVAMTSCRQTDCRPKWSSHILAKPGVLAGGSKVVQLTSPVFCVSGVFGHKQATEEFNEGVFKLRQWLRSYLLNVPKKADMSRDVWVCRSHMLFRLTGKQTAHSVLEK